MADNINEELKDYLSKVIILDSRQTEILKMIQREYHPELTKEDTLSQVLIDYYLSCNPKGKKGNKKE